MVTYRKAAPSDARLLAATRRIVWEQTYRGIYPDEMIDEFDFPWHIAREHRNLQDPGYHTYLVMEGGDCVGYFTFIHRQKPQWRDCHVRLLSLYLLPCAQGNGTGRRIFEFVADQCLRLGCDKFFLSCDPQNDNALAFYDHMGCVVAEEDIGHRNPEEDSITLEYYCNE